MEGESGSGKHGNTSVLDFGFLEPLDVEVVGETEGVEAYGTDKAVGFGGVEEEGNSFGHFGVEGGGCLLINYIFVCFRRVHVRKKETKN